MGCVANGCLYMIIFYFSIGILASLASHFCFASYHLTHEAHKQIVGDLPYVIAMLFAILLSIIGALTSIFEKRGYLPDFESNVWNTTVDNRDEATLAQEKKLFKRNGYVIMTITILLCSAICFGVQYLLIYNSLNHGRTVFNDSARQRIDEKRYQEAILELNKAISANPHYPLSYLDLAGVYLDLGEKGKALESANGAINADQNYLDAIYFRGKLLYEKNDDAAALRDFMRLIELDPKNFKAHIFAANLLFRTNDFKGVIEQTSVALDMDPQNSEAHTLRGRAHLGLSQCSQALNDFNLAIQKDSQSSELYMLRGITNKYLKDYDAALGDFNNALSLNRNNVEAYKERAVVFYNLGKYNEAWMDVDCVKIRKGTISPVFLKALQQDSGREE